MADEISSYQKLKISFATQPSGELSSSASGGGMPSAVGISGDVAASATVLAGLILVFLGAVAISFDLMRKRNRQPSGAIRRICAGPSISISVPLAKWLNQECAALSALALFCGVTHLGLGSSNA
jgi:hypothetical protein